jgi:3-oxo-5-alpha-steroid 4-dehydrogenase 1
LSGAHFIVGAVMFIVGMAINIHSDSILLNLRKPGETGYKIPYGGAFSLVSAANFFGEVFEWCGYAVATGFAPPGIGFALYTVANLVPRGVWQHRWYHDKFKGEYPQKRTAVIPYIL